MLFVATKIISTGHSFKIALIFMVYFISFRLSSLAKFCCDFFSQRPRVLVSGKLKVGVGGPTKSLSTLFSSQVIWNLGGGLTHIPGRSSLRVRYWSFGSDQILPKMLGFKQSSSSNVDGWGGVTVLSHTI